MGPRKKPAEEGEPDGRAHCVRRPGGDRLKRRRAGLLLLKPQFSLHSPRVGVCRQPPISLGLILSTSPYLHIYSFKNPQHSLPSSLCFISRLRESIVEMGKLRL